MLTAMIELLLKDMEGEFPSAGTIKKMYPKVTNFLFPKYLNRNLEDVIMGLYFGYPTCCIKYYCENTLKDMSYYSRVVGSYSDFYPCEFHAKEVHGKKVLLKDILVNRVCSRPLQYIGPGDFKSIDFKVLFYGFVALKQVIDKYEENLHIP